MSPILSSLITSLTLSERLCLMPVDRVKLEKEQWLSEKVAAFPRDAIDPGLLRVVEWPTQTFEQTFSRSGLPSSGDLAWLTSATTGIDLPEFFGSTLVGFPVEMDWDRFLMPEKHADHLDMLRAASERAERTFDLLRLVACPPWVPEKLPGRVGLLGSTGITSGLFYARDDHESYIVAGATVLSQIVAGIGLELDGLFAQRVGEGEVGLVARRALRLYSEALEASTETSRFVQLMSLLEFLADPDSFLPMQKTKRQIARAIARDRADYLAILEDFRILSSEGGDVKAPNAGLRHNIVHLGRRLEDLANPEERASIFKRLSRYVGATMQQMIADSDEPWQAVLDRRAAAVARLGLAPDQ